MPVPKSIIDQFKQIIPPLDGTLHKGQSGRVGVLGGAKDYTGAPFFAAMSAMRLGADLSHVICAPTAASAIKSYAPDLIVHPILREDVPQDSVKEELDSLLSRLHVLVIGPGLGRESYMQSYARLALNIARSKAMFLVLDADALWMVGQDLSLIRGYRRAVLTPNVMEFKRLTEQVGLEDNIEKDKQALEVSKRLGGVVVLQKGSKDMIAIDTTGKEASLEESKLDQGSGDKETTSEVFEVDVESGLKRAGGQGDVLSGSVGAMLAWGKCYETGSFGDQSIPVSRLPILASIAGSMLTRACSRRAFKQQGRGMVTADLIPEIGGAFSELFGKEAQGAEDKGRL